MIDHDTPTDRIETNFNYIYPSCRLFYIIFHIILLSNTIIGAIADKKDRRKIGVFPRSNFNFDSNRQISPRSLPFQTTIHPISIHRFRYERTNSFAFTRGKLLLLLLNTRKKEKKTNNWTKKYRFVDQRIVESRCSCRIEIASSLKFDRCFHSKYLKIDV